MADTLLGILTVEQQLVGTLTEQGDINGTIETGMADIQQYAGSLTITPSQSAQVLNTRGLRMGDNVTINPIPSNYGKITWNGSTLTVS